MALSALVRRTEFPKVASINYSNLSARVLDLPDSVAPRPTELRGRQSSTYPRQCLRSYLGFVSAFRGLLSGIWYCRDAGSSHIHRPKQTLFLSIFRVLFPLKRKEKSEFNIASKDKARWEHLNPQLAQNRPPFQPPTRNLIQPKLARFTSRPGPEPT